MTVGLHSSHFLPVKRALQMQLPFQLQSEVIEPSELHSHSETEV